MKKWYMESITKEKKRKKKKVVHQIILNELPPNQPNYWTKIIKYIQVTWSRANGRFCPL